MLRRSFLPLFLAAAPLAAQSPARGVTLADAIHTALRENPDVVVAGATRDSARAESRIARALPNPVLAGNPNTPYQYSASIPLDVTPQRFFRTRTASLGEAAAADDRADVERQTVLNVARAFYDALLAQDKQVLAEARRATLAQVLRADSLRLQAGDVPERNVARSEVELIRADADVERAASATRAAHLALQAVIGASSADTAFAAVGSLEYKRLEAPEATLLATALSHRADVRAANERVDQSTSARKAASALLFPTPELAYVRQYTGPFDNGHYYSFGLGFELPSLNLYRGQRERAAAGSVAANANARRLTAQVERDVIAANADFRAQRALVERYRAGVLSTADNEVSAMRYAYERGAASLLEVLDAVQLQQEARTEYLTALHDYWISIHTLNAAIGTDVFGIMQ